MHKFRLKFFLYFMVIAASLGANTELVANERFSKNRLSNFYSPHFLRLSQLVFGTEEIISQGGYQSIEIMFRGLDLNGKKALDIGSGFGGVAIYLAEKFDIEVIGVDREPYMLTCAQQHLEQHQDSLVGEVQFQTLKEPTKLSEFAENSFDVVYSKETFYHVPFNEKQQYIDEVFRVLKPGGIVIIADWFQSSPERGKWLKLASTVQEICQYSTTQSFRKILETANLQNISYIDQTSEHIRYTEEEIRRLGQLSETICQELGDTTYKDSLIKWGLWLNAQVHGDLVSGIFIAKKAPKESL
jgi:ubiquinone/menaquinone biosynthesis C-methylase UbiE